MLLAASPLATPAGGVVYRSIREEGHDRVDELKLPRYRAVACHRAWQVATKHFLVIATTSPEDAEWTAQQIERTWHDIGTLADHWTRVHRQPNFGIGSVNVWVVDHPPSRYDRPGPGPRKLNYAPDIFLNLGEGAGRLTQRRAWLRREAFFAFLRVAQQDQVLPDWLQAGLADYVAGEPLPETRPRDLSVPRLALHEPLGTWADRLDATRMKPEPTDRSHGILWTRYLLEGNDGEYAPALMRAMASTLARQPRDPFIPGDGVFQAVRFEPREAAMAGPPLEALARRASVGEGLPDWLSDPATGQPIVRAAPGGSPINAQGRQMALLLKLTQRFGMKGNALMSSRPVRPRVHVLGAGTTEPSSSPAKGLPDLDALYNRLTDPDEPAWATLNPDAGLLFSTDRNAVDSLFRPADCVYQFIRHDDRDMLEARSASGEIYLAWMEPNPKNPARPIVYVDRR
ncbi:MAG: hypothetical protein JW818_23580 [Pirellulales bacterium]|nr:hypothetical protein [Pirellulales bacterium]